MNKHRTLILFLLITLIFLFFSNASGKSEKPIVMRCAGEFAPPETISVILKELEGPVLEKTGGRVKFEYYPAAQLYTFPDAMTALQAGDLEMGFNGMPISFLVQEWDVISNLPFLIDSGAHMQRLQDTDAYKALCERMEARGIKPLTHVYPMDEQPLFNRKRPITKLEDLRGLKFSVGPGPTLIEAVTILSGSKPLHIPIPEVPSSLETGMLDASPFPRPLQIFMDLPRILPYMTVVPFGMSFPVGLVVSTKWWKTLPQDLQQTLGQIFQDAMERWGKEVVTVGEEQFKIYKNAPGTTVTVLSDEEFARWRKELKPLYDKLMKEPNVRAIMEAAEATR
ncbi:MAG: TRAP transporter substrate-binding protein DctP [Deltaproteobacteria bacterium]|nr:TRAP transporter substrate-binding protein DctP [Deltaproteobacteria bacterium]